MDTSYRSAVREQQQPPTAPPTPGTLVPYTQRGTTLTSSAAVVASSGSEGTQNMPISYTRRVGAWIQEHGSQIAIATLLLTCIYYYNKSRQCADYRRLHGQMMRLRTRLRQTLAQMDSKVRQAKTVTEQRLSLLSAMEKITDARGWFTDAEIQEIARVNVRERYNRYAAELRLLQPPLAPGGPTDITEMEMEQNRVYDDDHVRKKEEEEEGDNTDDRPASNNDEEDADEHGVFRTASRTTTSRRHGSPDNRADELGNIV